MKRRLFLFFSLMIIFAKDLLSPFLYINPILYLFIKLAASPSKEVINGFLALKES